MYRRMTMMKQTIAVLLAVFCLTLCLAALAEAPQVFTAAPEVQQVTGLGENTNTAAEGYIRKVFGLPDLAPVSRAPKRGTLLDPDSPEKKLYDALAEKIQLVANGQLESTEFHIALTDLFTSFTASELGVETIVANGAIANDAITQFQQATTCDTSSVIDALLVDFPYELFWYDKETGMTTVKRSGVTATYNGTEYEIKYTNESEYVFSMFVAAEYAVSGTTGTVVFNTSFVEVVQSAAFNANRIVQNNAPLSDINKLTAYKDMICDMTSYNDDAVTNKPSYGNPWQVIWVFDDDPNTSVVCEGYSKAFQWLCDMSSFQTPLTVSIVTGELGGGTGAGGHMWNIVTMANGVNYLVDVTNCDEGTIGAPDKLFMKGYSRSEVNDKGKTVYYYDFSTTNSSHFVSYEYDDDTQQLYGEDELTISDSDFDESNLPHEIAWTVIPEIPTADTGVSIVLNQEYQEIDYAVSDSNGFVTSGELYSTDTISLNGLSAGNFIIDITCFDEGVPLGYISVEIEIMEGATLIAYLSDIGEPVATYVPTFLDGDDIAITYQIDSAIGVSHRYLILETGENDGYFSMIELGDSAQGTWTLTPEEYGEFVDKGTIHLNAALTDINESNISAEQTVFQIISCDLRLPENLTSIEAEAFDGIAAQSIYIPASVNSIETGAIPSGVTLLCKKGSWALTWAEANGYTDIIELD